MKTKALKFGLAWLSLLFVHQLAFADGVFIPPAKQKMPDIPVQRALVKYHGGTESLIVESTLIGEDADYGWIIPVPSQPTKFAEVAPGLLETMSFQIQPKIHHEVPYARVFGIGLFGLFAILIVATCFGVMRWGAKGALIFPVLLVIFIHLHRASIVYRSGPGASSKANQLVKITSSAMVGDYDVLVLEVDNSAVLNTWLANNGFSAFPAKATSIIDDYIARGWVFVVATLRTFWDGTTTPHPILLEFETDQPVYPMRLTGIPGSTLYLELYIVAAEEATPVNYNLTKEYCNYYDYGKIPYYHNNPLKDQTGFIPREFMGPHMEIAHSGASKVMWDGCVVTKWAGQVTSDEMMDDMFFRFQEADPFRSEVYSSAGAHDYALDVMCVVCILGSILLTVYYGYRKSLGAKVSIIKLFIILLVASGAGFGLGHALVGEKAEVYTVEEYWLYHFDRRLTELFSHPHNISNGADLIELLHREGIDNPITHEPIMIEHSPGNLVVEETGDHIGFKLCLENGSLYSW